MGLAPQVEWVGALGHWGGANVFLKTKIKPTAIYPRSCPGVSKVTKVSRVSLFGSLRKQALHNVPYENLNSCFTFVFAVKSALLFGGGF